MHEWHRSAPVMDIKRLKSFVTVAEQGTVSKAANLLRITQPALSRQISGLEQEIGFELFAREGRRLTLTARGEQLLDDCRSCCRTSPPCRSARSPCGVAISGC